MLTAELVYFMSRVFDLEVSFIRAQRQATKREKQTNILIKIPGIPAKISTALKSQMSPEDAIIFAYSLHKSSD